MIEDNIKGISIAVLIAGGLYYVSSRNGSSSSQSNSSTSSGQSESGQSGQSGQTPVDETGEVQTPIGSYPLTLSGYKQHALDHFGRDENLSVNERVQGAHTPQPFIDEFGFTAVQDIHDGLWSTDPGDYSFFESQFGGSTSSVSTGSTGSTDSGITYDSPVHGDDTTVQMSEADDGDTLAEYDDGTIVNGGDSSIEDTLEFHENVTNYFDNPSDTGNEALDDTINSGFGGF